MPLKADWQTNVKESCALVRRAIAEGWETELGPEILAARLGDPNERMDGTDVVRVGMLLLEIDKKLHQRSPHGELLAAPLGKVDSDLRMNPGAAVATALGGDEAITG